jgi:hypothetical protein
MHIEALILRISPGFVCIIILTVLCVNHPNCFVCIIILTISYFQTKPLRKVRYCSSAKHYRCQHSRRTSPLDSERGLLLRPRGLFTCSIARTFRQISRALRAVTCNFRAVTCPSQLSVSCQQ